MVLDYTYPPLYVIIVIPLLLLFLISNPSHKTMALSPSFELQEMVNKNHHWVQTYGNSEAHLKSNYTDLLSVQYLSNGKTLNSTFWLPSGFKNSSTAIYDQPFRRISYGMLIDADTSTRTGYNGANYDFYIELNAGKLSEYLYELSATGGYRLVESKTNYSQPLVDPNVAQDSVALSLDLGYLNYPSKYNVLFYTAESYKSNEVRQFTSWVNIPPPKLHIITLPNNVMIKQGEERLIPASIQSTSGFSPDAVKMTVVPSNSEMGGGFNSSELRVDVMRINPPLFKIAVPQQTPLGIYTVPLNVTIRQPSEAPVTKPISINTKGGANPVFELSKRFPTAGYITRSLNLTTTVIPPSTISDQFRDFWVVYGSFLGISAGAFVGAFATFLVNKRKKEHEIK
jgi:hypothetical protein